MLVLPCFVRWWEIRGVTMMIPVNLRLAGCARMTFLTVVSTSSSKLEAPAF